MSDEHTPGTEHVREIYAQDAMPSEDAEAQFDRWLAAHDAKVKAEAWDEGYLRGYKDGNFPRDYDPGWNNPYLG